MWRVDEIQWSVDSPVIKPRWERKKRQSNTKQSSSLAQENSKEEGRVLPPISLFTKTVNLTRNNPMSTGRWWRHRRVPIGFFLRTLVTLGWMTFLHTKQVVDYWQEQLSILLLTRRYEGIHWCRAAGWGAALQRALRDCLQLQCTESQGQGQCNYYNDHSMEWSTTVAAEETRFH